MRAWEIWNEPNLKDYFTAQPFAKPYAALLRAAYPAVHGADPGATVLMASMANYSWRDLAKLLSAGGPRLRFDAAGAHPFSRAAVQRASRSCGSTARRSTAAATPRSRCGSPS